MSAKKLDGPTGWRHTGYKKKKKCDRCKSPKLLVVHHKDRNKANNADLSNLETLCRACHVIEHGLEIAESQRRPEVNARRGASLSKAKKGKVYPKVVAAVQKNWDDPKYHEKMVAIHNSPSTAAKHSAAIIECWNNPVFIEKQRLGKQIAAPKQSASMKKCWDDPEWRDAQLARVAASMPAQVASMKKYWDDPDWKENQLAKMAAGKEAKKGAAQ